MKNTNALHLAAIIALATLLLGPASAAAQNLMVGFNRVDCPPGSDTLVSVPFMKHPIKAVKTLSAVPVRINGQATLIPSEESKWTTDELKNNYYIRFTSGALAGHWYDVVGNALSSLTVDLNDEHGSGFAVGDTFMVVEYWTLDSLFPPSEQTTIHNSTGNLGCEQKTKILIPNITDAGTELPAQEIYFLTDRGWKKSAFGFPDAGSTILQPGLPFIIRHPAGVVATDFEPDGRVLRGVDSIWIEQTATDKQDNTVAVQRPVDVSLSDSGLNETAFASSATHAKGDRKDELLVFDNGTQAFNKSPSAIYYKVAQNWFLDNEKGGANPSATEDKALSASSGLIIRKSKGTADISTIWNNQPTY
jgi:uncharacterized protein (TIGR02597 family)